MARKSWGYIKDERGYKSASQLIGDLVDIVSKNGALLLNIGPRADGTIPEEEEALLLAIGKWLTINSEAIYDSRPWKVFGEGPTEVTTGAFTDTKRQMFGERDIRFTTRGDVLYATVLAIPEKDKVMIKSLSSSLRLLTKQIDKVELLGAGRITMVTNNARLKNQIARRKTMRTRACNKNYASA